MGVRAFAADGEPPDWLVDRGFMMAQHRACVRLLAELAKGKITPREGLLTYVEALMKAFDDRESELRVVPIRHGARTSNEHSLAALLAARSLYLEQAGAKYLADALRP